MFFVQSITLIPHWTSKNHPMDQWTKYLEPQLKDSTWLKYRDWHTFKTDPTLNGSYMLLFTLRFFKSLISNKLIDVNILNCCESAASQSNGGLHCDIPTLLYC